MSIEYVWVHVKTYNEVTNDQEIAKESPLGLVLPSSPLSLVLVGIEQVTLHTDAWLTILWDTSS